MILSLKSGCLSWRPCVKRSRSNIDLTCSCSMSNLALMAASVQLTSRRVSLFGLCRDICCPTGKSPGQSIAPHVQPLSKKYFCFSEMQIRLYDSPSCPTEGRLEIVTDAGQDAVDAGDAKDEGAFLRTEKACGPDAPTLASSS
jgi:hypothetical protein